MDIGIDKSARFQKNKIVGAYICCQAVKVEANGCVEGEGEDSAKNKSTIVAEAAGAERVGQLGCFFSRLG